MSSHKTVAKAAGLMMAAIFLSRILGLVREIVIAHQFGQGGMVSAYVAAFNVPDLLYFFMSSGALSSAFIPVFVQYLSDGKERDAWVIFSAVACFMVIVLGTAIIAAEIFARPMVVALAVPGFAQAGYNQGSTEFAELVNLTVKLTRIVLPAQLFFFLGGLMMGTLEARQRFTARALGPIIYNVGIILGGIVLAKWLGIAALVWGALVGAFAGNIVLTFVSLRRAGYTFVPNLNLRHPGVVKVAKLAVPVILGLSLPQIDVMINRWFASFLGDSAIAALNNGNRLMQVPLGVFAQAAAVAFFPTLAGYAARNQMAELKSSLNFALRGILFLTVPASVFMVALAVPIIRSFFQHGAFTAQDSLVAAPALIFYAVGIFAWGGQAVVSRGFYALQDTLTVIITGSIVTMIFIPMNYALMHAMGLGGLALATSIAATIHMFALMILLRRRIGGLGVKRLGLSVARTATASAALAAVCLLTQYAAGRSVDLTTQGGALLVLSIAGPLSLVVYFGLMWIMRSEELEFFVSMLKAKLGGKYQPKDSAVEVITDPADPI